MSRLISNQDAGRVDFYLYRAYDTGFVPIPCGLNLDVARAFPVSTRATDFHLDFLVPGISKCGTTSLCALLNQHPHLFIPEEKEPLFLFILITWIVWMDTQPYFARRLQKHCVGKAAPFTVAIRWKWPAVIGSNALILISS